MSGLSDYLNSLNRDGWSTRRISEEAEKRGHKLSNATASRYLSGKHGAPGQDVIEAFAAVFHVSPARVREAAGLPGLGQPFELGAEAARLTGPQREAIRTTVRLFVEQNDKLANRPVADGATSRLSVVPGNLSPSDREELYRRAEQTDLESEPYAAADPKDPGEGGEPV